MVEILDQNIVEHLSRVVNLRSIVDVPHISKVVVVCPESSSLKVEYAT